MPAGEPHHYVPCPRRTLPRAWQGPGVRQWPSPHGRLLSRVKPRPCSRAQEGRVGVAAWPDILGGVVMWLDRVVRKGHQTQNRKKTKGMSC